MSAAENSPKLKPAKGLDFILSFGIVTAIMKC